MMSDDSDSDEGSIVFSDTMPDHEDSRGDSRDRLRYEIVGVFDTVIEAQAAWRLRTIFVYSYDTPYKTNRIYGRVWRCRSHVKCPN